MIGNLLTSWIRQLCECCWTDCDCGCVEDCPLPAHREAARVPVGDFVSGEEEQ